MLGLYGLHLLSSMLVVSHSIPSPVADLVRSAATVYAFNSYQAPIGCCWQPELAPSGPFSSDCGVVQFLEHAVGVSISASD